MESLAENYDRLAHKSQEIIQTLQSERDAKIIECEELKTQVCSIQRHVHANEDWMHGVQKPAIVIASVD